MGTINGHVGNGGREWGAVAPEGDRTMAKFIHTDPKHMCCKNRADLAGLDKALLGENLD